MPISAVPARSIPATANADRLIDNFNQLCEAEGSTKRLRGLVLDLAVRGALVSQLPHEGTADALLDRIRLARRSTSSRRAADADDVWKAPAERPFPVPIGWRWVRLGDLGELLGGGTPSKSNPSYWRGPIPWVSPKDMKRPYIDDAEDHISTAAVAGSAAKLVPASSLLIVVRGMILAHSVPVALSTREVTINQDMKALVLASPEMAPFILRACQAARSRILPRVERSSHGTCRLDVDVLRDLPIPLPPLAEQKRIVAKVDQLMALCDALEARRSRQRELGRSLATSVLENLTAAASAEEISALWERASASFADLFDRSGSIDALRRSLRALALHGKLVRQDVAEGTAEQVLARLERAGSEFEQLVFPVLPRSWRWAPLGTLITEGPKNGYSPRAVAFETKVKSLTLTATTSGRFDATHFKFLDEDVPEDSELWLRDGDILIQRGNTIDYVGVAAIYRGPSRTFIYPDLMMRVRITPEVDLEFVQIAINGPAARRFITSRASGTSSSMPKINQSTVIAIPIPVPPLPEQRRIVQRLKHLVALCDAFETKLRESNMLSVRLSDSLVASMTTRTDE
jgi:type I restriction enzyme, S subunit